MSSEIAELSVIEKYVFRFKVNGQWHTKALTPELFNNLMENFNENSLIFDITNHESIFNFDNISDQTEMNVPEWNMFDAIGITQMKQSGRNDKSGSFFPYLNTTDIDLTECQIFKSLVDDKNNVLKEFDDCCIVYAFKQLNIPDDILNKMRLRLTNRHQHQSDINYICCEHKIHLIIHDIDPGLSYSNRRARIKINNKRQNYLGVSKNEAIYKCEMNLFNNHYFIEKLTRITSSWFKKVYEHNEDIPFTYSSKIWNESENKWRTDNRSKYFMKYSDIVKKLLEFNKFVPITYGQYSILKTIYFNKFSIDDVEDLSYDEKTCTQLIAPKVQPKRKPKHEDNDDKPKRNPKTVWYADFEADTSTEIHTPYMCCVHNKSGNIKREFRGIDSGKELLDFLPDNAVIYYHNLAYDIRFVSKYGLKSSIIKGTRVMKGMIEYNDKILHFMDTLPILSCRLEQLPGMFKIKGIKKELFPYVYYTQERLNNGGVGVINNVGDNEKVKWGVNEYETFNKNIDAINGCRIDEEHFDMWLYCSFYCNQDVNVLRLAFNSFCLGFLKEFKINPTDYISVSSLANEVFNQKVYYPNKNLYKVGGHVRQFMSKAIYGGRCMCAYNKKWHVEGPISDYDAVSLYPSAMKRLYTVEGKPEVLNTDQCVNFKHLTDIPDELKTLSAYVVEIKIVNVDKHYPFPLIVRKTDDGLNLNEDVNIDEQHPVYMTVDNILLEDLVNFQKITFDIVKGYVWNGKRDYKIQEVIQSIFNKRLEYKADKDDDGNPNPLEQLYKLIMNSCYGKCIEKPVDKDWKYKHEGNELDSFWYRKYNSIIDDIKLEGSDIHALRTLKPIDKHFNFSLLGIQVLSMSKRIMNEVMCLAYDIGCRIFYQDTDSLHIMTDDLVKLESAFEQKYNRSLKGNQLGQFHSDFPTINNHKEIPYSEESIFLMKKMYVDKLRDSTGDISYMFRGKGLTMKSIEHRANGDIMGLYKSLFDGNEEEFDLTQGQPCFKMNKNMSISTLNIFKRRIKTKYQIGNVNEYFT